MPSNGVELATAWIRLVPSVEGIDAAVTKEISGASAGLDAEGKKAGGYFSKGVGASVKGLAGIIGGAFVAGKVIGFFKDSMDAVQNWQTLNAQTSAVVKSTGGAANITAKQVNALAQSLEGQTATEAEAIQAGASMLLTFKNIRNETGKGNDIFNQSTKALVDMSRAMGTDPKTAAIQLGKALNDPIQGISALSRVGIQFTDDQKKMIKSLVEGGKTMDAQKIILGELNSQFGGSGKSYADTQAGKMFLFQDAVGDLGETLMGFLVPALTTAADVGTTAFNWLGNHQPVLLGLVSIIGVGLVLAFVAWAKAMWAANSAMLGSPTTWIILGIVALIAAVVALVMNWDTVVKWITTIWAGFIGWLTDVTDGFVTWWNGLWTAVGSFFTTLWESVVTWFTDAVDTVVGFVKAHWGLLLSFLIGPIGLAIQWIVEHWSGIMTWIRDVIDGFVGWWQGTWSAVGSFLSGVWEGIVGFVRAYIATVQSIITSVVGGIADTWRRVWGGVSDFFGGIWSGIIGIAKNSINGIIRMINNLVGGFNEVGNFISDISGGAISFSIPKIPYLADGGTIIRPGSVLVGEQGPEILSLPRGASVEPLDVQRGSTSASDDGPMDLSDSTMDKLADKVARAVAGYVRVQSRQGGPVIS